MLSGILSGKTHFTVALDPEYIPFTQKDIEGNPTGLLVDFWNYWGEVNGYTLEYKFYPWEETLGAVEKGEVDFHSGTTKDREWMHASDAIYELHTTLFTLRETQVNTIKDILHKRIGTIDAYYGELVQKATGDEVEIKIYEDYEPLVEALKSGEIDALVDDAESVRYYFIKTGQMHLFRQVNEKSLHFYNKIYAITNLQNSIDLIKINKGLEKLNIEQLVDIERTWLPSIDSAYYNKQFKAHKKFTDKEKMWLEINKNISLTGDPLWYPSKQEGGLLYYEGIVGDYTRVILSSIGNELMINPVKSWDEVLTGEDANTSDIIFGSIDTKTKNRLEQKYNFLEKSSFGPMVIIMDKKVRFITSLHDIKNKNIGILQGQEYTERMKLKYIDYDFSQMKNVHALLDAINSGKLDAGLLSLSKAINVLVEDRYQTLDIVGKTDEKIYIDIGVIKEKPILKNIIAKAALSLDDSYREKILSKWTRRLNYIERTDYKLTYTVALLLGLLLLSTAYYAYAIRKKHKAVKKMNRHIEHLSKTDDLTGLSNRRAFTQALDSQNLDKKISGLFFIDIDFFKAYNDFYGHIYGDEALVEIGEQLNQYNGSRSNIFRIGGEEFCMILYDYSEEDALMFADKVREDIENLKILHEKSPYKKMTVSVGVSMTKGENDMRTLYLEADKALYKAKVSGRNSIYLFKE